MKFSAATAAALALALALLAPIAASAATPCTVLTRPLALGSTDATSAGDVTRLQIFLAAQGFLASEPTGYYGVYTQSAVTSFQVADHLEAVGSVGPRTRVAIQSDSCGAAPAPAAAHAAPRPEIAAIAPATGKIGDGVTIDGRYFTAGTLVLFGGGALRPAVTASGTRATFRVPEALVPECVFGAAPCEAIAQPVVAGRYAVSVKAAGGESAPTYFTVRGAAAATSSAAASPSVSGGSVKFSFPTVSQSGSSSSGSSSSGGSSSARFSFPTVDFSTATSSSYYSTATYYLSSGSSSSGFSLASISPSSGATGATVTLTGSGFASTSQVNFGAHATLVPSVAASGQSLTFSVPGVATGTYAVSVENGSSETASKNFTVTR